MDEEDKKWMEWMLQKSLEERKRLLQMIVKAGGILPFTRKAMDDYIKDYEEGKDREANK